MSQIKFGTDGWRAVIGRDFTFENLKKVSQAIADYLKKSTGKKSIKVCVGYDARFLSKEFAHSCAKVLAGNGIKVIISDRRVPTPAVSFYVSKNKLDLGVMITASHNPAEFNGLKIKKPNGGAAGRDITDAVEKLLGKSKVREEHGLKNIHLKDITKDYIDFIRQYVNTKAIKKLKAKVLVDVMNGSGNSYLEEALKGGNVEFFYLRKEYNPGFEGFNPEPIEKNLSQMFKEMRTGRYDIGVALDGDADRIATVLPEGRYVGAQTILPLLAIHLKKNRGLSGGIVKTIVGSNLIDKVAADLNCILFETPVGFKYISSLFEKEDIAIGGEEAGGIGFKGYIPERDGTVAAALIMEMMVYTKRNYRQLIDSLDKKYGRWYYQRISFPIGRLKNGLSNLKISKSLLGKKVERINDLDGIKIIAKDSWLMFRASGTEPIIRVYSEAKTQKEADRLITLGKKMVYAL